LFHLWSSPGLVITPANILLVDVRSGPSAAISAIRVISLAGQIFEYFYSLVLNFTGNWSLCKIDHCLISTCMIGEKVVVHGRRHNIFRSIQCEASLFVYRFVWGSLLVHCGDFVQHTGIAKQHQVLLSIETPDRFASFRVAVKCSEQRHLKVTKRMPQEKAAAWRVTRRHTCRFCWASMPGQRAC